MDVELYGDKAMVCPALGSFHLLGDPDLINVSLPDSEVVNQMEWQYTLEVLFNAKVGVLNYKIMFIALP